MSHRAALFAILLPGLALAWDSVEVNKRVGPSKGDFSIQLPADWLWDGSRHSIESSHDGPGLNHLSVAVISQKDMFKNTKKRLTPTTSPEDLAEDYIAEIQTGPQAMQNLTVLTNEPAELAGKPAFRLHLKYRVPSVGNATMESVVVGTALAKDVLLATFEAPSLHYFERWADQVDEAVRSITLSPPPKH